MKYHFAHLNRIDVSVGQQVTKGQVIGLLGKTGTTSAHLHYEVQKIFRGVTDYTKGMSKATVQAYYLDPYTTDWQSIIPFNNMGWDWLSDIGGGQLHPGLDLNAGIGDSDLNTPIKSPVNGVVYYAADDTNAGWGKHIFIEEGANSMEWYSIKGQVFHNDEYVDNPAGVPWDQVKIQLNPIGYQIIDDDELRALQNKPPVEVIKEVIKEVPVEVIKEVLKEVDSKETLKKLKEANDSIVDLSKQLDICKKSKTDTQTSFSLKKLIDAIVNFFNKRK